MMVIIDGGFRKGGVVLARTVPDPRLSDEILECVRRKVRL
jgi:hypothetical protein